MISTNLRFLTLTSALVVTLALAPRGGTSLSIPDATTDRSYDNVLSSSTARNRRDALISVGKNMITATAGFGVLSKCNSEVNVAFADEDVVPSTVSFGASWKAVDGLNSLDSNSQFVSFDASAYRAMRDDPTRTPQFREAIERRLGDKPETITVVDLGTGPFALFAIIAAQAGAGKVYAIEANPEAAQSARTYVKQAGCADVVTILEGFSSDIKLEEKADFCIAEIVGSVASEEGAYATIRDAHSRLLKNPDLDSSWIPSRIQTYAAPASYTLHNLFEPPMFDWTKLKGEPVRFNCRDNGLQLLSDPVLIEDISFAQIKDESELIEKKDIQFTVNKERIEDNQAALFQEFRRGKSSVSDSELLAKQTAHSLSGIAMWPRIFLDESTIIDSRHFRDGGHQRSHWQTVLPIMAGRPIGGLNGGENISISYEFKLPTDVLKPPTYTIQGQVKYV